jgi:hypothetical protein
MREPQSRLIPQVNLIVFVPAAAGGNTSPILGTRQLLTYASWLNSSLTAINTY